MEFLFFAGIGRGMKVASEEYLGMLVALGTGLQISAADDCTCKRERLSVIVDAIGNIPAVTNRIFVAEGHARKRYLDIDWNENAIGLIRQDCIQASRDHDPAVGVRLMLFSAGRIQLPATVMYDGDDAIVGQIIRNTSLVHT